MLREESIRVVSKQSLFFFRRFFTGGIPFFSAAFLFTGVIDSWFSFYVFPGFHFIALFFWFLKDNRFFMTWSFLLFTVCVDVLMGSFLGSSFLQCLLFILAISPYRTFLLYRPFVISWAFFFLILLIYSIVLWVLCFVLGEARFSYMTVLFSVFWVGIAYPFVVCILTVLNNVMTPLTKDMHHV